MSHKLVYGKERGAENGDKERNRGRRNVVRLAGIKKKLGRRIMDLNLCCESRHLYSPRLLGITPARRRIPIAAWSLVERYVLLSLGLGPMTAALGHWRPVRYGAGAVAEPAFQPRCNLIISYHIILSYWLKALTRTT